jgi:hypothetical protein
VHEEAVALLALSSEVSKIGRPTSFISGAGRQLKRYQFNLADLEGTARHGSPLLWGGARSVSCERRAPPSW